ncbi:MAG: ATP-binding protein [Candidatus Sungbacteria bacterium]|uniref:ATP-binding protein n=1 Tax=Candidatus Sungiibacteriota bacterium TaxID=2750080 RepID=A0A932YWL4_9BACT|nr:ATP-binding protein [Candidatus Sungbacteria bacterium]
MDTSRLEFHQGQALLRLAGTYPTLQEVLFEEVQNALDEGAQRVWINMNQRMRHLTISDNGRGATTEKFDQALRSVGSTVKPKGKLGRFGLGLISPLGKCVHFTFTSTPQANPRGFHQWTFVTTDIAKQAESVELPRVALKQHRFAPPGTSGKRDESVVPWRTQVRIENYSDDRVIGHVDVDSLHEGILDRYAAVMRRLGTVVSVRITKPDGTKIEREVRAESFAGRKLEEFNAQDKDAGTTAFRLFIARRTEKGRRGRVLVGEQGDDYRLHFGNFAYAARDWLDTGVTEALSSGIFEGEIITEKAKLHASRKRFENDAALVGLCGAVGRWYAQVGKQYYEEAQEQRREERLQELGQRSIRVIESMLDDPSFEALKQVVEGFRFGTVTTEHVPVGRRSGGQDVTAVRVYGEPGGGEGGERDRKGLGGKHRPAELEGDTPYIVLGPRGPRRKVVRGNSLGLGLSHEEFVDPNKLWDLDERLGIVRINIKHPTVERCERSGRFAVMRLQELIMVQALVLHTMPESYREQQRIALEGIVEPLVFTFTTGDVVAGRKLGRKAKAK